MATKIIPSTETYAVGPSYPPPPRTETPVDDQRPKRPSLATGTAIHFLRLLLSGICLACSVTIIACEAHALSTWEQTNFSPSWLQLWPKGLDLRGARFLLSVGVIGTVLSTMMMVVTFLPPVSYRICNLRPSQRRGSPEHMGEDSTARESTNITSPASPLPSPPQPPHPSHPRPPLPHRPNLHHYRQRAPNGPRQRNAAVLDLQVDRGTRPPPARSEAEWVRKSL